MAISLVSYAPLSGSASLVMPDYPSGVQEDDFVLVFCGKDTTGGTWAEDGSSDFTKATSLDGGADVNTAVFWLRVGGSAPTPRTFTAATEQQGGYVTIWRGVHTTTAFADSGTDEWTSNQTSFVPTALDTTGYDNCVCVWFACADSQSGLTVPYELMGFSPPPVTSDPASGSGSNACSIQGGWTVQESGGTTVAPEFFSARSETGHAYGFALRPASETDAPPRLDPASPPLQWVHPLRGYNVGHFGGTLFDPTTYVSNVDGETSLNYYALSYLSTGAVTNAQDGYRLIHGSGDTVVRLAGISCPSIDLSGSPYVGVAVAVSGWSVLIDTIQNNGIVLGLRSGTSNFRFWVVGGKDHYPFSLNHYGCLINIDSGFSIGSDTGTFDKTDVTGIVVYGNKNQSGGTTGIILSDIVNYDRVVIIGGSSSDPAKMSTFRDSVGHATYLHHPSVPETMLPLQIGNGSTPTYFYAPNQAIGPYPRVTGTNLQLQVEDGFAADLIVYASADCTIDLRNSIWLGDGSTPFTIHASSSSSADYKLNGCKIIDRVVTLRDVFDGAETGGTFTSCAITINSANLRGGHTFDECTGITITSSTEAGLQSLLDDLANCTFTNAVVGIRIEYTGTGDIELDFDNITGSGNTDDVHYNSTNSSALTCNLLNGSNFSTDAISGSATSVTFQNTVTLTVTCKDTSLNAISGARVLLEASTGGDLSNGTDILEAVTNGSGEVTTTFNYTNPQPYTVKARKGSSAPYYAPANSAGTITSSGLDLTVIMVSD